MCDHDLETDPNTFYVSLVLAVLSISGRDYAVSKLQHGEAVLKQIV